MNRLAPQTIEKDNNDEPLALDELIPRYALNKSEADAYKKLCDRDNTKIKEMMLAANENEHYAGNYIAKVIVSQRETMNEQVLISIFDSAPEFMKVCEDFEIIKFKPYIDFDALENAIYHEALTDLQLTELNKAKEVKEVISLKVTRRKEGK